MKNSNIAKRTLCNLSGSQKPNKAAAQPESQKPIKAAAQPEVPYISAGR